MKRNNDVLTTDMVAEAIIKALIFCGILAVLYIGFWHYAGTIKVAEDPAVTTRITELESKGFEVISKCIVVEKQLTDKVIVISYDDTLCSLQGVEKSNIKLNAAANSWLNQNDYSITSSTEGDKYIIFHIG